MELTQIYFFIFLTTVIVLYWLIPNKARKYLLLISSIAFIASWGLEDLTVFGFSILIDFFCAIKIGQLDRTDKRRKFLMFFTVAANFGLWGSYKWLDLYEGKNYFIPIGLSYYSFQSLGYTISVYWNRIKPTKNFFDFLLFNAFFPQLSAGPIERAENILPQIRERRKFEFSYFQKGLFLLGLGYFKKMVVTDRLMMYYLEFSNNPQEMFGFEYIIMLYSGFLLFYFDMSSYADIARGIGWCFGFKIMDNFNRPYLSQNPTEMWSRWHISVTTWMKDFMFMPILMTTRNLPFAIVVVYLFFGFWHAVNIGFLFLGMYWGVVHIIYVFLRNKKLLPNWNPWINRFAFFHSIILSGIFILPSDLAISFASIANMFNFEVPFNTSKLLSLDFIIIYICTAVVLVFEKYEKSILGKSSAIYWGYFLIFLTVLLRFKESHVFFYFRV